jgi:hypothetical protein
MPAVLLTRRLPSSALRILQEVAEVDVTGVHLDAAALCDAVRGCDALISMTPPLTAL